MNFKTISKLLFILMATIMVACNDNEPGTSNSNNIPETVIKNFNTMYPNAQNVSWVEQGKYAIAHFSLATRAASDTHTAWYLLDNGSWGMTETEINFSALPEAIKIAFNASEYAQSPWILDNEIEMLTRTDNNETIYVLEVEKQEENVETELDLYYTEDGTLVKTVIDAEEDKDYENLIPEKLPEAITSWLGINYPNAKLIETEFDNNIYEIEFLDADTELESLFNASGNWILTKMELDDDEIPANILDALKLTEVYAKYSEIEDIDKYETASAGTFYEIELENEIKDIEIFMDENGVIIDRPEIPELKEGLSVSETIANFIDTKYPGAVIVKKEMEDGFLCIKIKHDGNSKELRFNGKDEWIDTEWDIDLKDVPATIMEVITSNYPNATIDDDVEFHESAQSAYYEFEIIDNNNEIDVLITIDGKIINQ